MAAAARLAVAAALFDGLTRRRVNFAAVKPIRGGAATRAESGRIEFFNQGFKLFAALGALVLQNRHTIFSFCSSCGA